MGNYTLTILIIFITLPNFFCNEANKQRQAINNQETVAVEGVKQISPQVEVDILSYLELNKPLMFNLRIKNGGNETIYFYSALLNNPKFLNIYVNSEKKIIEVRFTRFHTFQNSPNYFPDAEFIKVEPNEVYKREFTTEVPFKERDYYDSDTGAKWQQLESGTWKMRVAIAYSYEIESVQKKIAEVNSIGKEHPINPIVEWQKIAYSNYESIAVQK